MEIKLKVIPPTMPNYVRLSDDKSLVDIENFTQEEAELACLTKLIEIVE